MTTSDWALISIAAVQAVAMIILVCVTIFYAVQTRKMATEMKNQRYDAVRPVIDIERAVVDQIRESLAAQSEEFSYGVWCIFRNIGVGPAIDVYSFILTPNDERRQRAFGTLAIGERTLEVRLSMEQKDDRKVVVAYYKDVHERWFESRREVSVDKKRRDWKIGPLETEVRKIAKGEFPK